jgi:hypothetical protein
MIQTCAFKDKRKEGGEGRSRLGGQWKFPNLVAKHLVQSSMEGSMFGFLWKEKEKHHFHLLPLFTP